MDLGSILMNNVVIHLIISLIFAYLFLIATRAIRSSILSGRMNWIWFYPIGIGNVALGLLSVLFFVIFIHKSRKIHLQIFFITTPILFISLYLWKIKSSSARFERMNKILTRKHKLDQNISHFETKLKYIIKRKGLESAKEFINSPHTSLENHPNRYQLRQKYLNLISSLQKIQKIVKEKTSLSFTKLSTQYGFSKTFLINFQHEWGKYLPQIDVSKNMIQIT